jgi:formimidoylglutamate deiminase
MSRILHAPSALLPGGWARDVTVALDAAGRIVAVVAGAPAPEGAEALTGRALLPAPGNLHSHAFQRAMAGLTETRGPEGRDSFWTWRARMYAFLEALTPDDVEAIAAQVFVETLEAGYAAVGEFHYLHHGPGGAHYDDIAEMGGRAAAAAAETGVGLTLLPVLYERGGCDGRALEGGARRFAAPPEVFARLHEGAGAALAGLGADARLGVAPHSLRAASPAAVAFAAGLDPAGPVHIHAAEQTAEVAEVEAALGARPVRWLLDEAGADRRWCLIHATQMDAGEVSGLAAAGAVAGLCPITEGNLGDGIFEGAAFRAAGGAFGIGSDSNLRITLAGELAQLESSQRLRDRARAVLCDPGGSTGRALWDGACAGSARALGRDAGAIEAGRWADLVTLDMGALALEGLSGDALLDAWIFAGTGGEVSDVWSAGRRVVTGGRHHARDAVERRFRSVVARLRSAA